MIHSKWYNLGYAVGIIAGIAAGIILGLLLRRTFSKGKKLFGEYDERQEIKRNRGYKYCVIAIFIGGLIFSMLLDMFESISISHTTFCFVVFFVGIFVHITYTVFTGSYFGLDENYKKWRIVAFIIGVYNIFLSFKKPLVVDNTISDSLVNLLCGILLMYAVIIASIKYYKDKRMEEDYED